MPRIQWSGLPPALRDHLFDRLRERKITAEDLYQLKTWRESDPEAPDGLWYKDFGSFKICGEGKIWDYGRSDTRENLRRFFEMDRHHIAVAALSALADENKVKKEIVTEAIKRYGIANDAAPVWER